MLQIYFIGHDLSIFYVYKKIIIRKSQNFLYFKGKDGIRQTQNLIQNYKKLNSIYANNINFTIYACKYSFKAHLLIKKVTYVQKELK